MRNRANSKKQRGNRGFTLIELMIVVVVIGILATIGVANFLSMKQKSMDAAMKSDVRGSIVWAEDYRIQFGDLPPDLATFEAATGFQLSPNVEWDTFALEQVNGEPSLHLIVTNPAAEHKWRAHYPSEGAKITAQ